MYKVCKYCKAPFDGRKDRLFCSRNCWREYNKSKTIYCEICNAPLTTMQRCNGSRHCSRRCGGLARRGLPPRSQPAPKICPTCNNQFVPRQREIIYCSRECYYASYRQKEFACKQCGVTMRGRAGRIFCSPECYAIYRSLRTKQAPRWPYGPNWKKQRRKAYNRARGYCQQCGEKTSGRQIDVHHIIPFSNFGIERYEEANDLTNLIALCRSCHMIAHKGLA